MLRFGAALAVLLTVSLGSLSRAHAQRIGALRATSTTPIELAEEALTLDCQRGDTPDDLACALRVRWSLHNPTTDAQSPSVVLTWLRDERPEVRVGGALVAEPPTLRPLTVIVPPGATVELELVVALILDRDLVGGPHGVASPLTPLDPLHARHPLLSTPWIRVRRGLAWARPTDLHFASVGSTRIEVSMPEGWQPSGDLHASGDARGRYESPREPSPGDLTIELTRGSRGELFRHGGPFLALGATIDESVRGRVGYELGLGEHVLVAVALDTDFERQVVLTPQVDLATWGMVIVPSLALGLGVPVRLTDDADRPRTVGIRIEASATFFAAAFVATLDVWPVDATWQLSLLGRVGL